MAEDNKCPTKISGTYLVEHFQIAVGNLTQGHNSGGMDDGMDFSECLDSGFEEPLDIGHYVDICLHSNRRAAARPNRRRKFLASGRVAGIGCRDSKAVLG